MLNIYLDENEIVIEFNQGIFLFSKEKNEFDIIKKDYSNNYIKISDYIGVLKNHPSNVYIQVNQDKNNLKLDLNDMNINSIIIENKLKRINNKPLEIHIDEENCFSELKFINNAFLTVKNLDKILETLNKQKDAYIKIKKSTINENYSQYLSKKEFENIKINIENSRFYSCLKDIKINSLTIAESNFNDNLELNNIDARKIKITFSIFNNLKVSNCNYIDISRIKINNKIYLKNNNYIKLQHITSSKIYINNGEKLELLAPNIRLNLMLIKNITNVILNYGTNFEKLFLININDLILKINTKTSIKKLIVENINKLKISIDNIIIEQEILNVLFNIFLHFMEVKDKIENITITFPKDGLIKEEIATIVNYYEKKINNIKAKKLNLNMIKDILKIYENKKINYPDINNNNNTIFKKFHKTKCKLSSI